jgi:hypothetical protein
VKRGAVGRPSGHSPSGHEREDTKSDDENPLTLPGRPSLKRRGASVSNAASTRARPAARSRSNTPGSFGRVHWQRVPGGLRDARYARAEIQAKLGRGELLIRGDRTLADVGEEWLAAQHHHWPSTRSLYVTALERHINSRLGNRRISDITVDRIGRVHPRAPANRPRRLNRPGNHDAIRANPLLRSPARTDLRHCEAP